MKNPKDLVYYCRFEPHTGKKVGGYIEGIHEIPMDAVKVSYNDFLLYAKSPNYVYNWETKQPEFKLDRPPVNIEKLRSELLCLVNEITKKNITSGFTVKIDQDYIRFDSDMESQSTYNNNVLNMTLNPESTVKVRGYVNNSSIKTVLTLSADQMKLVQEACANHINTEKERGWERQTYVKDQTRTIEELEVLKSELEPQLNVM